MTQEKRVIVRTIPAALQNRFQAIAKRFYTADKAVTSATVLKERAKREYAALADEVFGQEVAGRYALRAPYVGHHLCREIAEPREFDIDGLRKALTPAQFATVTKPVIDTKAFDAACERGDIDLDVIAEFITFKPTPKIQMREAGARSDYQLQPGQIAFETRPALALQEA